MCRLPSTKLNEDEKAKRTMAAIKYQHLFPDSFEPHHALSVATRAGVVTGKPGDTDYKPQCETTRKFTTNPIHWITQ